MLAHVRERMKVEAKATKASLDLHAGNPGSQHVTTLSVGLQLLSLHTAADRQS